MKTTRSAIVKLKESAILELFNALNHKKETSIVHSKTSTTQGTRYFCLFCRLVISSRPNAYRPTYPYLPSLQEGKARAHAVGCGNAWAMSQMITLAKESEANGLISLLIPIINDWADKYKVPHVNIAGVGSELYISIEAFCHSLYALYND